MDKAEIEERFDRIHRAKMSERRAKEEHEQARRLVEVMSIKFFMELHGLEPGKTIIKDNQGKKMLFRRVSSVTVLDSTRRIFAWIKASDFKKDATPSKAERGLSKWEKVDG